ncbi:MAG TPA: M15 family metallopeptidase, partial [Vicinamibacterales bacterium]|nr:M15 family metallopeptidase [Vicinamibacterales bacterium]
GDAQTGDLKVMFDGPRVNASYDPMRKQGAILLGNGGDNSVGSQGTFYEGAMTAPNTFPTLETNQKVQANVVAAKYDVARVTVTAPNATATPSGLQTFSPGSSQDTTVTFTNTTGAPASGVELSLSLPKGWTAVVAGTNRTSATIAEPVPPGASVTATFKVTSSSAAFNGDLVGNAKWTNSTGGVKQSDTAVEKVRNVSPITINEFRVSGGVANNTTNSFIELYNGSAGSVDISNWTLTTHATQQAIFSTIRIPAGTRLAAHGFYLLGLSNSGLAAPARKSDSVIHVRSTAGMSVGETIEIGTGPAAEMRKIMAIGTAAANNTTLWQPLPDGPVITIPAGATNVPVTSVAGVEVGQKIALGYGATYPAVAMATGKYEIVTVTAVGKQGTQAWLSADGKAGDTNIKVSSVANVSVGDKIRLDIDSVEHGIETVTVTRVGTQSARNSFNGPLRDTELGTGLDLAEPLKFNHRANLPFSNRGTGISFTPATAFAHSSNEPVQAVGTGITLDKPLVNDHAIDAVVRDASVTAAGYQGTAAPNQWFGGPALANAGAMVLRDAAGLVVDSLNYGLLVDPWAAEGYHGVSGAGQAGCRVTAPGTGRGGGQGAQGGIVPDRSAGRFPDGRDTDSNCNDFLLQSATVIAVDSGAGATNIKVAGVNDFSAGQPILIDAGTNQETATIATVGTAGATTVAVAATAGATVISIGGPSGFVNGQSIHIDTGANAETAVVVSTAGGGRGGGAPATPTVTVAAPLKMAHAVGAQVAGTGITLTSPLSKAHANGARVASAVPTPGAPNQYLRKPGNPTPVPNWPREAERPDAPKPQPAARWLVAQVGEYQGPSRPDGTAPRLYLLEENGRPMYIVDRGEARPAAITVLEGTPERASAITIDGVRYERQQVGPEGSGQLRVESIRPVADVLKESMTSPPPTETGDFLRADLVELVALDPTVHLDIRYATTNNFLGSVFYAQARAFLQRPAADSLLRVQQQLRPLGYGLLVHDGYRPWFVTRTFWECTPEDKKWLVANPASGSKHNRGAAVDLTLYDLATGAVIDMPSTYDESTPRAYAFYPGGTSLQRWHRALLRRLMEAEGFTVNPDEWWHFDYKDWRRYALGNVAFEHIK